MYRLFFSLAACLVVLTPAAVAKDRPVTPAEREKLVSAISAEGCAGGKLEFDDDGHYEVDDAKCGDGLKYDLKFDTSFKLVKKKVDD